MYLRDKTATGKSLVEDLASPPYIQALANFERVDTYANAVSIAQHVSKVRLADILFVNVQVLDRVVPYVTGGIEDSDPFMLALAEASRHPLAPPPPPTHALRGLVLYASLSLCPITHLLTTRI